MGGDRKKRPCRADRPKLGQVRPKLRLLAGQNVQAVARLELFVIFAVTAILGTRAFLALTGYPQLGGNGLHVAHML